MNDDEQSICPGKLNCRGYIVTLTRASNRNDETRFNARISGATTLATRLVICSTASDLFIGYICESPPRNFRFMCPATIKKTTWRGPVADIHAAINNLLAAFMAQRIPILAV